MSLLLDTDTCSHYLRGAPRVHSRFIQHMGRLHLSSISLGELYTLAFRAKASATFLRGVQNLLHEVQLLTVDHDVAYQFGQVRAQLLDQGQPVATADLLIAATALLHGLTLVTHNVQDFQNIPGLQVVDWLVP